MPLLGGKKAKTKKGIQENIRREHEAHPEQDIKQDIAIAYSKAGKSRKKVKPRAKVKKKREY